jgi:ATP-dependent DNA helicase DinG
MEAVLREVFGAGGFLSQSLSSFENRPQQLQMACAVQKGLSEGRHTVVEAGTGVGKSFAYLVPAINLVYRTQGKVLISTFTITLQEQLTNKDVPFLTECLPYNFKAALAKGRGNYLCRRRLKFALRRQGLLFDRASSQLAVINDWASRSKDGSLSDLGFVPSATVWDAVSSEHGNCRGRKCVHFRDCFYWRARRQLDSADIIVTNHALLFSDLVLKEQGASVLPDYRCVIIDEAQNIEHVAEEHFGIDISNHRITFLLNGLYNPRTHKGLLAFTESDKAMDLIGRLTKESGSFFKRVRNWYESSKGETNGRCFANFVDNNLSGHLNNLRAELAKLAKNAEDADEKFEIMRFADRCAALAEDIDCFLLQKAKEYVYWVEVDTERKTTIRLKSAALNVGEDVKRCLFDRYDAVIMTSATLSSDAVSQKGGFGFFAGRIGLEDFDALKLGSPFDYEKQVTIYIEKDLPDPNEPDFVEAAIEALKKYILRTKGRAFVLFTSYEMLGEMAEKLYDWLAENDIELLQQGAGIDRTVLLKQFRDEGGSVLFGTDSFWQGVDVPGEALSNVIIVRLPFAVPDKPLIAGRLEQIRQQGGNPFYDYQLPSAILKFKQGFGRLVRTKSDRGIVVILDSRIVNKRYGQSFLDAIPKCGTEIVARNP